MIADLEEQCGKADETDLRVPASIAAATLLLGIDPAMLIAFVEATGSEGESNKAEDLGAKTLEQVYAMLADEKEPAR